MLLRRQLMLFLLSVCTAWFLPPALAQNDENVDTMEPPHAGQMREAGPYYLELVTRPNRLTVYITDHRGNKSETRGASATAIVSTAKTQYTVKLRPVADNVLRGKAKFILAPDTEIMIALSMPEHAAVEYAQFQPRQEIRAAVVHKPVMSPTSAVHRKRR